MMSQPLLSQFTVIGKLKDLDKKSKGSIKSIEIATEERTYSIKIAEELKDKNIGKKLKKGCLLKITGICKNEAKKGKVKYKAYEIEILDRETLDKGVDSNTEEKTGDRVSYLSKDTPKVATKPKSAKLKPTKTKTKVMFCKKSTCWKKGGEAAYKSLKAELRNRGIADGVEVKTVGCLKQCKKAPNLVIMPDKARYSKVKAQQVSGLIKKHILPKQS